MFEVNFQGLANYLKVVYTSHSLYFFQQGDLALQAKESDADFIGGKELIPQVKIVKIMSSRMSENALLQNRI